MDQASLARAREFVDLYYKAFDDAAQRQGQLPNLYAPTAQIVHNGNPMLGDAMSAFFASYPSTKTQVQSFDCHAIPGTSNSGGTSPNLLLSISGQQTHAPVGEAARDFPPPPQASKGRGANHDTKEQTNLSKASYEALPRMFSDSFVLAPVPGNPSQYLIQSQTFRFVG